MNNITNNWSVLNVQLRLETASKLNFPLIFYINSNVYINVLALICYWFSTNIYKSIGTYMMMTSLSLWSQNSFVTENNSKAESWWCHVIQCLGAKRTKLATLSGWDGWDTLADGELRNVEDILSPYPHWFRSSHNIIDSNWKMVILG